MPIIYTFHKKITKMQNNYNLIFGGDFYILENNKLIN